MSEENKAILSRVIAEAWNKGNMAAVNELVATNYEGHDPSWPEVIRGPEGFKQWVGAARTLFPDFQITVEDLVAEGDRVASRITMRGSHQGTIPGFSPPTGKQVTFQCVLIRRFAGGKMVEGWDLSDVMGLMRQLGAVPAQG